MLVKFQHEYGKLLRCGLYKGYVKFDKTNANLFHMPYSNYTTSNK